MSAQSLLPEPGRVDEPRAVEEFVEVFNRVATEGRPVILRRCGEDLAAVIPVQDLELIREILARPEVQKLAAELDWERVRQALRPPQEWFEGDEPKPF